MTVARKELALILLIYVHTLFDRCYSDEIDRSKQHPCRRACKDGDAPMKCYYSFKLEAYRTMSKACYDCPFNITDCFRPHCVPADGMKRSLLVIDRRMPGPAIEVCQGDKVTVDITNMLHSESTTMHWHGQHHIANPYMDGVPHVSQCPISPGATFRYEYIAAEAGTHFWHSHLGFQRGDGVFGPLIVRVPPSKDTHRELYDVDVHTIVVLDWIHELTIDMFLDHHHAEGDNKPATLLVNGLGRYGDGGAIPPRKNNGSFEEAPPMPLATFIVKQNMRYRFRLINAEFLNCPIEISVDNHTMYVISSDGRDLEPVEAMSLVSYAGERFDFVIETSQEVNNYWIRFRGLMDCDERFTSAYQAAILRYEGAPDQDPEGTVSYEVEPPVRAAGWRVNALNEGTETNASLSIPLLDATDENDPANTKDPDYQFYVSYDFYDKDNAHYHRRPLYGFHQVKSNMQVLTPQLNHISLKLPPFPLLSQRELVDDNMFCNSSSVSGCEEDYCACTHVLRVRNNSVVEVILVDEGFAFDANHPFHLHGYLFRVIAMERVGSNVTVEEVKRLDAEGKIHRKLDRAPLKDTVTVPDGGYTIIRFHANNPGYWLFHCHIEFHSEVGMSLIFKVGEHEEMPPVPRNFPRCGDWKLEANRPSNSDSDSDSETKNNDTPRNPFFSTLLRLLPLFMHNSRSTSSASGLTNSSLLITSICVILCILLRS